MIRRRLADVMMRAACAMIDAANRLDPAPIDIARHNRMKERFADAVAEARHASRPRTGAMDAAAGHETNHT